MRNKIFEILKKNLKFGKIFKNWKKVGNFDKILKFVKKFEIWKIFGNLENIWKYKKNWKFGGGKIWKFD